MVRRAFAAMSPERGSTPRGMNSSRPQRTSEPVIARASSTTHEHLLAVLATEAMRGGRNQISVLDAGCGNGRLIAYLQENMRHATRTIEADVFGFDVYDDEIQRRGFLDSARELLSTVRPDADWADRLRECSRDEPWPFGDEAFDFVVSNQVGEHIASLDWFFHENARVLKTGGLAAHLFPLRNYVLEGHLLIPLVHRIASHDLRRATIGTLSRMGIGKYRRDSGEIGVWAEQHADYVQHLTHYRTWPEVAESAKRAGLRVSYRYTPDYYWRKIASLIGRSYPYLLRTSHRSIGDAVWFRVFRLVSSVTIVLEKRQTYPKGGATSLDVHGSGYPPPGAV
jgi:SAM-dependent methyltransferase